MEKKSKSLAPRSLHCKQFISVYLAPSLYIKHELDGPDTSGTENQPFRKVKNLIQSAHDVQLEPDFYTLPTLKVVPEIEHYLASNI